MWTDGSLEPYPTAGFAVAGVGVFLPAPELAMEGAIWEVVEEYGDAGPLEIFRRFSVRSFLGNDRGTGQAIWEWITSMWSGLLHGCWTTLD